MAPRERLLKPLPAKLTSVSVLAGVSAMAPWTLLVLMAPLVSQPFTVELAPAATMAPP